ncbi:ImmA/IrrE family metallo-endopeptidase [Paenibacillus odorifer]|uniref:ImmA/IrrE family metallo-endopeptidase n=1 Tax=Paenibacillus odorifer TaxID=189426 RepID=A0A1R0X979_9BACL|nr:ImmA/IrrE family metallo-endopeptidase [Paenibacillus odorifer]OMD31335.1 ImmA/IrrE family metallo-endopeptidase [Paenibacillus odorifer]
MIKSAVNRLTKQYKTNDPFQLAKQMGIPVILEPLGDMFGYYNKVLRNKMIHINEILPCVERRYTCAHELGHAVLHPDVNTPFLRKNTLFSVDRIEREANRFAVELLIPDETLLSGFSLGQAAALCGVPEELSHLKETSKILALFKDDRSYIRV